MNSDWSFGYPLETVKKKSGHQLWTINCWLNDILEEITLKDYSLLGEWVQSSHGLKKVFCLQWKQGNVKKNVQERLGPKDKKRTLTAFTVGGHITTSHTNVNNFISALPNRY